MEEQVWTDENIVIHFDKDGQYVEILGHKIDRTYESFEAFVEEMMGLADFKEKIKNNTYYDIKNMSGREIYEALCRELSFNKMIELERLIQHKMNFLDDEVYDKCCCASDE